ncbi:RING finger protein 148-like [Nelusetta ayraudi]|uniref:RING finger protein 148-like n=1 Tax=Nelusetta ayraudi TaxID=303726 RepID=UPI003F710405
MGETRQHSLLLLLCLSGLARCSSATVSWTANVDLKYVNGNGELENKSCACGLYGRNSVLMGARGVVALPMGDPEGCDLESTYSHNASSPPWIALVKRGNCTFGEKIAAAVRHHAVAVVVYNVEGGDGTIYMSHPEARGIVAIMIGNVLGSEIAHLVKNGTEVTLTIMPGRPHGHRTDLSWLYYLRIVLLTLAAVGTTYMVFRAARGYYIVNKVKWAEKRLKTEAKRAIRRLQVRTLKRDDEEAASDVHMCAVCMESYKAGEVVTVLTCDHIFHKACIEPWLLERRSCPMCKCDILKALRVEKPPKEPSDAGSPPDATVITVTGGDAIHKVPVTDLASRDPERHPHRYDNRAFEGESVEARG